jgi:hypothetical protein
MNVVTYIRPWVVESQAHSKVVLTKKLYDELSRPVKFIARAICEKIMTRNCHKRCALYDFAHALKCELLSSFNVHFQIVDRADAVARTSLVERQRRYAVSGMRSRSD